MTDITIMPKPRRHAWPNEVKRPGSDFADGNDRTERICPLCGLKRFTVHPPHGEDAWREWRKPTGESSRGNLPPCVDTPVETLGEFTDVQAI